MTTKLSCRDVEGLIIEGEDRELPRDAGRLVAGHLRDCPRCRGFAADRSAIRETFASARWPAPPELLVRRTRTTLLEAEAEDRAAGLPAWVLATMALMAIITGVWLAVSLADVTPDMTLADLPIGALAAVLVIVENALALVFAPVLLRTVRARRNAPESAR
jgi:hypothetical protein